MALSAAAARRRRLAWRGSLAMPWSRASAPGSRGGSAIDPIIVRVAFVVAVVATRGGAVAAYVLPGSSWTRATASRRPATSTGSRRSSRRIRVANWRVAAGVGFLTLAFLLVLREIGPVVVGRARSGR